MAVTQRVMLGVVTATKIIPGAIKSFDQGPWLRVQRTYTFEGLLFDMSGKSNKQTVTMAAAAAMPEHELNQKIDWKFMSPTLAGDQFREIKGRIAQETGMPQEQWTIEVRATFDDPAKGDAMETIVKQAARHILANAALMGGQVKPQIACYSDNFFSGHKDINVLADDVGDGKEQLIESGMEDVQPSRVDPDLVKALQEE